METTRLKYTNKQQNITIHFFYERLFSIFGKQMYVLFLLMTQYDRSFLRSPFLPKKCNIEIKYLIPQNWHCRFILNLSEVKIQDRKQCAHFDNNNYFWEVLGIGE